MKKKKLIKTSEKFDLYYATDNEDMVFAIQKSEIEKMNRIKKEFYNKIVPDKFTIKAFYLDKVREKDNYTDEYGIINQTPINCRINNLTQLPIDTKMK